MFHLRFSDNHRIGFNLSQSHLYDAEAEVSSIEHNDFVLIGAFVQDVAQGEE